MRYVFEQMRKKDVKIDAVTYTSVMHWVSSSGDFDGAMRVWEEMKGSGCSPTVVSYTAFMKVLFCNNRVKEATDAYREMLRSGLSPNCHTYTVLMEYLVGSGNILVYATSLYSLVVSWVDYSLLFSCFLYCYVFYG